VKSVSKTNRVGDLVQVIEYLLAFTRPWVQFPEPKTIKKRRRRRWYSYATRHSKKSRIN
jgi:hypothetical protein